jgi:hypothetical protein
MDPMALSGAGRFLNTMSVRYALRADRRALAESTVALFTKEGDNPSNLHDMQCMWYEIELGRSCMRSRAWGKALKNLRSVDKHFTDIVEDQFDFHSYCMRKMTLRSYIALLRTEDRIYAHQFFVRAASATIQVYIALHDRPAGAVEQEIDPELAGLSEKDREKVLRKRRKAERKAAEEAEEAAKAAGKKGGGKQGGEGKKKKDADPDGEQLAQTDDPMGEATKFVNLLAEHAGGLLQTQTLSVEVFMRKGRLLKALQALKRAAAMAPTSPQVHRCTVRFLARVAEARAAAPAPVQQVLDSEFAASAEWGLPGLAQAPGAYNAGWIAKYAKGSVRHAAAGAEAMVALSGGKDVEAAADLVLAESLAGCSLAEVSEIHAWAKGSGWAPAKVAALAAKAKALFPLATAFQA